MKFGTRVIVRRGSGQVANNLRDVPGTLVGARGSELRVMLDFLDGTFDRADDTSAMWFAKSQVRDLFRDDPHPRVFRCWSESKGYPVTEENILSDSFTTGLDRETHDRLIIAIEVQTERADKAEEALSDLRELDEIGIVARKTLIAENEQLRAKLSAIYKIVAKEYGRRNELDLLERAIDRAEQENLKEL